MSESSFDWFVQMAGGVVLGPMPREDLAELAQSGGLLPGDLVRKGEEGDWQPASEVDGLIPRLAGESSLDDKSPEDADFELQPGLQLLDDSPVVEAPSVSGAPEDAGAESSPGEPVLPDHLDLLPSSDSDAPPQARPQHPVRQASKPAARRRKPAPSEPALAVPNDVADEPPFQEPSPTDFDQWEIDEDEGAVSSDDFGAEDSPADGGYISPRKQKKKKPASKSRAPDRSPRDRSQAVRQANNIAAQVWWFLPSSLRRKAIFAVIGAIAFGLFELLAPSLLPSDEPFIYESLSLIHGEILAFDSGELDPSEWAEFTQWAGEELELNRPWLEENAVSGERGRSLLLYVSRDLEEMLQTPPGSERPHQQRVEGFFEQLEELYASSYD
jgi:hypothetical protein